MQDLDADIAPPPALLFAIESRGILNIAGLLAAAPFLISARRGVPHPVIVIPGLGGADGSTMAIRRYLRLLGYQAHGWNRGRNDRPAGVDPPFVAEQIRALSKASGSTVSLVGWSRGGIIAREATRLAADCVRMVITLGSPFAAPAATNILSSWRLITGESVLARSPQELRALAHPLPVPTTSIYSRGDGVVAWRACRAVGPRSENVEVRGSHIGLGFNAAALWVIADRLAQPFSAWAPFRPGPRVEPFFPRRA
jgi:pimeloyl-ACP methyl ester carboxylesterase